jgi:tetratricopeptide (TPR) repeat protein
LIKLGDYPEAERRLGRLMHQAKRFQEKRLIFGAEFQEGLILRHKGDVEGAAKMYQTAIEHFKEYKWYFRLPEIFFEYADLREELGETEKARELFKESLEYAEIMKDPEMVGEIGKRLENILTIN